MNQVTLNVDVLNIGALKAPLLIFGGCYSNYQATKALRDWAASQNFLPEQCICTGDMVAYCGNPYETVELIRGWGVHCIQGNVEQSLAEKKQDCGCGFEGGSMCEILSHGWFPFADSVVTQGQRDWFRELPEHLVFSLAGYHFRVVHGAISNISRFMFASQIDDDYKDEFSLLDNNQPADVVLAGHSGLPFTKKVGTKYWHNSGALGMPANDGTADVWFSVLDVAEDKLQFTHHRLSYDAHTAQQTMLKNGLTQGYHEALITGLWPSMDVLPEVEKNMRGVRLKC